jgi:hypothetical protein
VQGTVAPWRPARSAAQTSGIGSCAMVLLWTGRNIQSESTSPRRVTPNRQGGGCGPAATSSRGYFEYAFGRAEARPIARMTPTLILENGGVQNLNTRKQRPQLSAEPQRSMPTAMLRPVNSAKVACVRVQLCECLVLCQCLLCLSVHFPTGIARRDKKLPGPHTSVKPRKPKKFGAMLFEDCLRLLGGLDHFLRFVALEACKLYNGHDLIPPLSPPLVRSRSGRRGSQEFPMMQGPSWVKSDRSAPAAGRAMSVVLLKRKQLRSISNSATSHSSSETAASKSCARAQPLRANRY